MKKETIIPLILGLLIIIGLLTVWGITTNSAVKEKEEEIKKVEQERVLEEKYQEGLEQGEKDLIIKIGEQLSTTGYYKLPVTLEDGSEKFLPLVIYKLPAEE